MKFDDIKNKFPKIFEERSLDFSSIDIDSLEPILVYRAILSEKEIDISDFLPTYISPGILDGGFSDIGNYSISTFDRVKDAQNIAKFLGKRNEKPYNLAVGMTNSSKGIWQRTFERTQKKSDKHHIDYWIFDGEDISIDFKKYIEEE